MQIRCHFGKRLFYKKNTNVWNHSSPCCSLVHTHNFIKHWFIWFQSISVVSFDRDVIFKNSMKQSCKDPNGKSVYLLFLHLQRSCSIEQPRTPSLPRHCIKDCLHRSQSQARHTLCARNQLELHMHKVWQSSSIKILFEFQCSTECASRILVTCCKWSSLLPLES